MVNRIGSLVSALMLAGAVAVGETNDGSRISSVEMTTKLGNPAVKLTADNLSTNSYNFQYATNLTASMWTTDFAVIDSAHSNRTFYVTTPQCFYKLKRR